MTTTTARQNRKAARIQSNGKKEAYDRTIGGMQLAGEVITWLPGSGNTYSKVVQALKESGLNDLVAKVFLPKNAFNRASKKLCEEGVLDPLPSTTTTDLAFQYTGKALSGQRWHYSEKDVIYLNESTGKIQCGDKELEEQIQVELDRCMEARNGNDITQIVTQLFEQQLMELIHLDSGVYFIPNEMSPFTGQIDAFLRRLGGRVNRFPVPKGTQAGDRSIQEGVAAHFQRLIADLAAAVAKFGLDTRPATLESAAEEIRNTRVKIQAYASYLGDKREELLTATDTEEQKLREKVTALSGERTEKALAGQFKERPSGLFGFSISSVLNWMGRNGWRKEEAQAALEKLGIDIKPSTIQACLSNGKGGKYGKPAALEPDHIQRLEKARSAS